MSRILEKVLTVDPLTGTKQIFRYDPTTEETTLITIRDDTPILEQAQEDGKGFRGPGGGKWNEMNRVARLPMAVFVDLQAKGILGDQQALKKFLNHSDNRVFRTRPGRL